MDKEEEEVKVTYNNGNETRVLRGVIKEESNDFIALHRRDGVFRINKKYIINIEYPINEVKF